MRSLPIPSQSDPESHQQGAGGNAMNARKGIETDGCQLFRVHGSAFGGNAMNARKGIETKHCLARATRALCGNAMNARKGIETSASAGASNPNSGKVAMP